MRYAIALCLICVTLGQSPVQSQSSKKRSAEKTRPVDSVFATDVNPFGDTFPKSPSTKQPASEPSSDPFAPEPVQLGKPVEANPDITIHASEAKPVIDTSAPIWLVIGPNGLRVLQTPEEITIHQHTLPADSFLIGCHKFSMNGNPGEQGPDFNLECENVILAGTFGTKKKVETTAAKLVFETNSQQLRLTGTEEKPVQLSVNEQGDQMRLEAQEIVLQLSDLSFQMTVSGAKLDLNATPDENVKRGLQPIPDRSSSAPMRNKRPGSNTPFHDF